jgi:hypothetical protein
MTPWKAEAESPGGEKLVNGGKWRSMEVSGGQWRHTHPKQTPYGAAMPVGVVQGVNLPQLVALSSPRVPRSQGAIASASITTSLDGSFVKVPKIVLRSVGQFLPGCIGASQPG